MNDRIKVMHVVESFAGGVFTSVTQIVSSMDRNKFDTTLVYSGARSETPTSIRERVRSDVRLVSLPMSREIRPWSDVVALLHLWRLMRRERPDVVHLHSSKAGGLGRVAARLTGVPHVFYSPRGLAFLRQDVSPGRRALYRWIERIGAWFGGTVVACSQGELEAARQVTTRTALIPNAIDLALIDEVRSEVRPHRGDAPLTIAISGRVAPQRAPGLFARIATETRERSPRDVKFLWIGDGDVTVDLAAAPVEICGWLVRDEALRRLWDDVDIYLHTSLWEGLPLAILEAMALGKPVVATNVVGNRDAVADGETGLLADTAEGLVSALLRLIEDAELRDAMGRAGRARVEERFSLPAMLARYACLYGGEQLSEEESAPVVLPSERKGPWA